MPHILTGNRAKMLAALVVAGFVLLLPGKPAQADDRIRGYLWSTTAGWISMSCTNSGTCATSDYSVRFGTLVTFNDPAFGGQPRTKSRISGYAWSSNLGWICFGTTCDGVPDKNGQFLANPESTAVNYAEWRQLEPYSEQGRLYGWARLVSVGSGGWMALNCDNFHQSVCDPLAGTGQFFYVARDSTSTNFCEVGECDDPLPVACALDSDCQGSCTSGRCDPQRNFCSSALDCGGSCDVSGFCQPTPLAYASHWSWSGNADGSGLGWIDWSLAESDWVPPLIKKVIRPQGIYEPDNSIVPGVHPSTFDIIAQGVYSPKDYMLRCDVTKPNGDQYYLGQIFDDAPRFGDDITFTVVVPQLDNIEISPPEDNPIQQNTLWYLEGCMLAMEPLEGTSCTVDADCGLGNYCDAMISGGAGACRQQVFRSQRKPIYVHRNAWTLFDIDQDFYEAVKCYAQFEGEFFNNPTRCDFRGDATFSMAMNKGIPIERNCSDGIDNDGNGSADCLDPFCRSVSTFCCPCPVGQSCQPCESRKALECDWATADENIGRCESLTYKPGELCCSRQNRVVNGMECQFKSPDDGYYDCECVTDEFGLLPTGLGDDCQPPGYTYGDLCCTRNDEVIKASEEEGSGL